MIPRSYPTLIDGRKAGYMRVFFLTSVSGLTKWIDYIPVKTVAFSSTAEGTTNANGHINVAQVSSSTALRKWVDYIPVFEDGSATVPWSTNANGYIPVNQMLDLDFRSGILDSRITFTRADASTCATYFDSTGRLQTATANTPRFDYDPAVPNGTTGGELATAFDSSWTANTGVTTANGVLTASAASAGYMAFRDGASVTTGKTYLITFAYSTNANFVPFIGGTQGTTVAAGSGVASQYIVCGTTGRVQFNANGTLTGTISNVSIKEVTFTPRGLLIEESRQNLLLQSRDMTQAAWTKTDVTPARTQVGIDGVANTACLMTEGSAGTATCFQAGTVAAGSTITVSYALKRGNNDWIRVSATDGVADGANAWFNLSTGAKGTVAAVGAGTNNSSTITSLGGGWYRCTVTTTPNGTYTSARAQVRSAASDGGSLVNNATYIVDCAQLEVGAFATSIIPTTTTALTRAADSASMTGTNFSSWYNQTAGTFVVEASHYGSQSNTAQAVFGLDDGGTTNEWRVAFRNLSSNFSVQLRSASVEQFSPIDAGTELGLSVPQKLSFAVTVNDAAFVANGALVTSDTSVTLPVAVNRLCIGNFRAGTSTLSGHIRRLTYYPTRLANAQLQALTA